MREEQREDVINSKRATSLADDCTHHATQRHNTQIRFHTHTAAVKAEQVCMFGSPSHAGGLGERNGEVPGWTEAGRAGVAKLDARRIAGTQCNFMRAPVLWRGQPGCTPEGCTPEG